MNFTDEEQKEIYRTKTEIYQKVLDSLINEPWIEDGITINITSFGINKYHHLLINCEAWYQNKKLALDLPFIYVNPPLIHNNIESPLEAGREIVFQTVKRFI